MRSVLATAAVAAALVMLPAAAGGAAHTAWLCRPGLAHNPCETGRTATVLTPSGRPKSIERALGNLTDLVRREAAAYAVSRKAA
jgi:hypothetical protein